MKILRQVHWSNFTAQTAKRSRGLGLRQPRGASAREAEREDIRRIRDSGQVIHGSAGVVHARVDFSTSRAQLRGPFPSSHPPHAASRMSLSAAEVWERLLLRARAELPESTFRTWLEP